MNFFLLMTLSLISLNSMAENVFDDQIIICKKDKYILNIDGNEKSVEVLSEQKVLVSESYKEKEFKYNDRRGQDILNHPEYVSFVQYARSLKPRSVSFENDITLGLSKNAKFIKTYHAMRMNGETDSIILELASTKERIKFELNTDCSISK